MAFQLDIQDKRFTIPESGDPCELWISYFEQLKKTVGLSKARMVWLVSWKTNGAMSCTTSPSFITWMQKNKIDVSSAATRAIADATTIGSNFMGLGKNLSNVVAIGVPISLGIALLVLGRIVWNTSTNVDLVDIASLTPTGKGMSAALKVLKK